MSSLHSRSDSTLLLVIDLDDTLIRSRSDRASLLIESLIAFGVEVDRDRLGSLWGRPFREVVVGLAPQVSECFDEFVSTYCEVLRATPPETCPGVDASGTLLGGSIQCVVHTASHSRVACADLESAALDSYFGHVVGSDRQSNPKPDARSGLELLTSLGFTSSRRQGGCYIGDSLTDMAIAEAAGLGIVAVDYGAATRAQWLQAGLPIQQIASSFDEAVQVAGELA